MLQSAVEAYFQDRFSVLSSVRAVQLDVTSADLRVRVRRSLQIERYSFSGDVSFLGEPPSFGELAMQQVAALGDLAGVQAALDAYPLIGYGPVIYISFDIEGVTSGPSGISAHPSSGPVVETSEPPSSFAS